MTDYPRRRTDRTGRSQFIRKSTRAEVDRRDAWVARLHRRGHSTAEICDALDIGPSIARITIRKLDPASHGRKSRGRGPVVGPCPWRDEDIPTEERVVVPSGPRWQQSRIVGMAQMLNDEYRESNFSNVLANQATDAEEAGDQAWLLEALATLNAAIEKLERARRVLTDDHYRAACRDTLEGVEQIRRRTVPLRAVH